MPGTETYDKEGNRTMTGYTTTIGNRLTADGTYTYSYDNDGNMVGRTRTSDSQVTTFTYDYRNRLTEVLIKTSTGTTVQDDKFTYDVENRRIGKNTLSGGQSWTGYVDANPYADFNSGGSLTFRYLYGNAIDFLLGRVDPSGNAMWYLTDKLGSVREDVNMSGSVLDSITYDSYGNILTESSPSSGDRFKYTSREWDSEIGQYFYRARYYGPSIGRFESEDPLGTLVTDNNIYRYVHNAPTNSSDPTGLKPVLIPPLSWPLIQWLLGKYSPPPAVMPTTGTEVKIPKSADGSEGFCIHLNSFKIKNIQIIQVAAGKMEWKEELLIQAPPEALKDAVMKLLEGMTKFSHDSIPPGTKCDMTRKVTFKGQELFMNLDKVKIWYQTGEDKYIVLSAVVELEEGEGWIAPAIKEE